MLDPNSLVDDILNKFKDKVRTDTENIQIEYADIVKKHFEKNASFIYTWVGASSSTPPVPDPVVAATGTIKFSSFDILPAKNLIEFCMNLSKALKGGTLQFNDKTFSVPMKLNPAASLFVDMSAFSAETPDPRLALTFFWTQVILQFKTMFIGLPANGTHTPVYSGIMTMTTIL